MLAFIKKRAKILIGIGVLVIAVIVLTLTIGSNGSIETVPLLSEDLVRTVKIAGKVIPRESAGLSFETAGIVRSISKNAGQSVSRGEVVARLDSSAVSAEVLQAEAELALSLAELSKLGGGGNFSAQIDNAKSALIQDIKDAYTASDDAVHNKTDQVFVNPRNARPELIYAFGDSQDLRNAVTAARPHMDEKLDSWKSLIAGLTAQTYTDNHLVKSREYLSYISEYINNVAQAVNLFEAGGSLGQSDIDGYKADALGARNNVNTASENLITTENNLRGFLGEMPVQVARVDSARASLANARAKLYKTYIISPITGIVSRQDAKVGQVASAAVDVVVVISRDLEIEAYIPEILISGVSINNPATITLDAYGDKEIFEGKLVYMDPAETIRDGVSTYKVRVAFNSPDARVRPGMTANISIETLRKAGTILIPERAVIREDGKTYIFILENNAEVKTVVEVGERDSQGNVELVSKLASNAKVITNPDKKEE